MGPLTIYQLGVWETELCLYVSSQILKQQNTAPMMLEQHLPRHPLVIFRSEILSETH